MIPVTRKTILLYLAGTFVLGAVAGGALGYGWGRRPVFKPFDRDEMRAKFCNRLVNDLELTEPQQGQLDPIIRQNMDEFEAVQREQYGRIGELMKRHRERVASILTPEQRARYEALEREREQRFEKERGGRHQHRGDAPRNGGDAKAGTTNSASGK
jgi:hypothetical protein